MEKNFDDIGCPYFISPYLGGWLVKGCAECYGCTADNWFIWKLRPDRSIENTFSGVSPGPFYTGITSGNFIAGDVYTGVINLCDANGAIIDSTTVWEEENGWSYEYGRLGEVLGAFFVLGASTTRLGCRWKAAKGIAQEKEGARGAVHALANCAVPAYLAFLSVDNRCVQHLEQTPVPLEPRPGPQIHRAYATHQLNRRVCEI